MATIEARITKVEHDLATGWYSIHTDHESVKKLTTKMDPKAKEAAGLRQSGEVALIRYSHKQRTDDSSGRTYNNYYYEQAATAPLSSSNGAASDGIDTIQAPQSGSGGGGMRKLDPIESWRIALSVGAKLAVQTLPLMDVDKRDFGTQKQIALAWAMWVYQTPAPAPVDDSFGASPNRGPGAYDEPTRGYDTPPPPGDDDIPF